jgi:hypothetical protein
MDEIRAFIGQSFLQGDEELVGRFLKLFDRLSKLLPFSWGIMPSLLSLNH